MKSTKIMLAVIATFLITWCVMGLIGWMLSDLSYKECMTHGATLMLLLLFGCIPAIIVGNDLDNKLED
jgi:fucose permease